MPKGIATSGFPAVDATCRKLGLEFDPWQADLNKCLLAKGKDGLYAADMAVMSIPRQVGKTWDIGAVVFALCIINPGTTVVWTAHRFKVARETFNALRGVARSPQLAPHIDQENGIYSAAGNESITFRNGSRIVFAARERGAVRGFSEVEVLVLDEGQILTDTALADLVPTTNQARNPLIIIMGTPPRPVDPGEVFRRLRTDALSGDEHGVLYVEFSAPASSDPDDRDAWKAANPSYPKRTPTKSIVRMRKALSTEDFIREAMGIWDEDGYSGPFSAGAWDACATTAEDPIPTCLGLALDIDRVWLSLGASSGKRVGALMRVRIDTEEDDLLDELERVAKKLKVPVVVDPKGPAGTLIEAVEDRGVKVIRAGLDDYVLACAEFYDEVEAKELEHGNHPELNAAVRAAGWRFVGDRRVWSRKLGPIEMLEAATLAKWGASQDTTSVYEERGVMVL